MNQQKYNLKELNEEEQVIFHIYLFIYISKTNVNKKKVIEFRNIKKIS